MKRTAIITVTLVLLFVVATPTAAQIGLNLDYPEFFGIDLATQEGQALPNIIAWFYAFIVIISGLVAFAVIVYGGIRWMTSAGNPTLAADAKDRIQQALLGLLLILSSFIILQTINPELRSLTIPGLDPIEGSGIRISEFSGIFFTANGLEEEIVEDNRVEDYRVFLASPEDVFQLEWRVFEKVTCTGRSVGESDLWSGIQWEPDDSEAKSVEIGPLREQKIYTFILECPEKSAVVQVDVMASE